MADQFQVAVVDDDPRLRTLIAEEVSDEGVTPFPCETGSQLLKLLEDESIDLILLDLMMPEMDGFRCLEELKNRSLPIPVIVVTALNDDINRQKAGELGAADYILKPDLFERLPHLLDQHLGPRNLQSQDGPSEIEAEC